MRTSPNAGGPPGLPALLAMHYELAALQFQLAMVKFKFALQRHYNSDQPRDPAGSYDGNVATGGRWSGPSSGSGHGAQPGKPVRAAQNVPPVEELDPFNRDPLAAGNQIFRVSPYLTNGGGRVDTNDPQWAYTSIEAENAVNQVRQREAGWRPTPGLYADTQGAIEDNIAIRQEAEERLRWQDSVRMGHNGPPEDPFDPSTMYYENIDPLAPNDTLRSIADLPDLGGKPAVATEEGTLAVADINGRAVLGVNSSARSYTSYDRAAADAMREQLLRKYPYSSILIISGENRMTRFIMRKLQHFYARRVLSEARSRA